MKPHTTNKKIHEWRAKVIKALGNAPKIEDFPGITSRDFKSMMSKLK